MLIPELAVSKGRNRILRFILRKILQYENKPEIGVDKAP